MMSGPHAHTAAAPPSPGGSTPPPRPPRLRLKPKAPATGHVDGAWWPRSRNLALELPALAEALTARLGPVVRVAFALDDWNSGPRRAGAGGRTIRLEGSRTRYENVVHVFGPGPAPIRLLLVPPGCPGPAGLRALTLASRPGSADKPADILAASGIAAASLLPAARPGRARPEIRSTGAAPNPVPPVRAGADAPRFLSRFDIAMAPGSRISAPGSSLRTRSRHR